MALTSGGNGGGAPTCWVVVTGASTGIGREVAVLLAARGFGVYACARRDDDLAALSRVRNVVALRLDVRSREEIRAAARRVSRGGGGLYGLVNNAGMLVPGPLMELSDEDLQAQFDVNIMGVHRTTRAFAPLLMRSRGRIVMVSSVSSLLACPYLGAYAMSKSGLEGYSNALRRELFPFGVHVSIVQPGFTRTALWRKIERALDARVASLGGSPFLAECVRTVTWFANRGKACGIASASVARRVLAALTSRTPRPRYLASENDLQYRLLPLMPVAAVDRALRLVIAREAPGPAARR